MRASKKILPHASFLMGAMLLNSASGALADESTAHRFSGSGRGVVARDRVVQSSDRFSLRGYLADASASSHVQSGGTFALSASVTSAANVCYNDTIFRDDFDGDGF